MYAIKELPEDFIVKEIIKLPLTDKGNYAYYSLEKKNYNTNDAIEKIARHLKVKLKSINAAGLKDKKACTEQYISIFRGPARSIDLENIKLSFVGRGEDRINVGSLEGNEFKIVVRNIKYLPEPLSNVPNFFDQQRFGKDYTNHLIGRCLVKNQYSEAISLLSSNKLNEYLKEKPNDYVGALKIYPKRKIQFLVTAYQSYLWNKCIEKYLAYNPDIDETFPVPGFNIEVSGIQKEILDTVLAEESLSLRGFINRSFPELSCDGHQRRVFTLVENLSIGKLEDDEIYGKKKVMVSFYLNKGNYATNVIKHMFRNIFKP
ncbi:MAG: tRNA pseudouridine(13) synthase TruD [Nanobdellota archaeon]